MLRELVAGGILAATLGGIWWLGALRLSLADVPSAPLQVKMQGAERIVHYRFGRQSGPVFHLDGDEVELRLITHLVLEAGRAYSAEQSYDYGMRLWIEEPDGSTMWERELHTATRQSKEEWTHGFWMRENAFSLEPGVELTDDRVHRITLPEDIPWGSRFHVQLDAPAADYGVIRAYEHALDTSLEATVEYFPPAPWKQERLVGRLTYLPWDALTEEQKQLRLRKQWDRMSALGELGEDYEVDTIFYTGFRAPPAELPAPPLTTLVDDRATALTTWGPGVLTVMISADCTQAGQAPPRVSMVHLDAMGVVDGWGVDPCDADPMEVWLPDGPHSIHVRGHDLPPTEIEAWYDDFREPPIELPGLELGRPFRQTITRSPRVRLGPGLVPADYSLVVPDDLQQAMVRVRARLPVVPRSEPGAQRTATLRYSFVDERGLPIEKGEWTVEPTEQLDEYEFVVDASDATRQWWVSQARDVRFFIPMGARRLLLESDESAIVSVYTYWPGAAEAPRPYPPYDEAMLVGTRWRRIPFDYVRWYRIEPHNAHVLQRNDQTADLHGPVRLELRGDRGGGDGGAGTSDDSTDAPKTWVSLEPSTRHETRTVLVRDEPGSPLLRWVRWEPGMSTLDLEDDWGGAVMLLTEGAPQDVLGQTVRAVVDGTPVEHTVASTRARWRLPRLGPGLHQLELQELPPGVSLFVDRPTLRPLRGSATGYRVVTLHRLDGRTMRLWADKQGVPGEYVNAVVYRCGKAEPSALQVEIDRGVPKRRRGVAVDRMTRAVRERVLPARGTRADLVFLDRAQDECDALGRVPLPLGGDLQTGRHELSLRVHEGPGVWVRFFRQGTPEERPQSVKAWTERSIELEEDDGAL